MSIITSAADHNLVPPEYKGCSEFFVVGVCETLITILDYLELWLSDGSENMCVLCLLFEEASCGRSPLAGYLNVNFHILEKER